MEGERVIFVDEVSPGQYLKLIASGAFDATLFEGLQEFTLRWQKRLDPKKGKQASAKPAETDEIADDTTAG